MNYQICKFLYIIYYSSMGIQIPVSFVRANSDIGMYQYNGLRIKLLNNGPMRVDYFPKKMQLF